MADSFPTLGTNTTTWMRRPNWAMPLKQNFAFTKTLIDYIGLTQIWNDNTKVPRYYRMEFVNQNKTDEKALLDFFQDRQGQVKGFWIPSWHNQFTVDEVITSGAFTITLRNDNFHVSYNGHEYIMLVLTSGDIVVRKISAAAIIDGDQEYITLATAVDRTIQVADVELACLFLYARFDSGKLTFSYQTDSYSTVTIPILELPREYP